MNIPEMRLPPELEWINSCTSRNYYNAIWATLVELRPKYCLEIGTFQYYASRIFSKYFELYQPDGFLITADISTWNRSPEPPSRVYPVMVYPHRTDIDKFHGNINVYHADYKERISEVDPVTLNMEIIDKQLMEFGVDFVDFTFIDGDHTYISFINDFTIAQLFTHENGHVLIDDIKNPDHELAGKFDEWSRQYDIYQYENWERSPDMGLLKTSELNLL